jgi:hypothetical protein
MEVETAMILSVITIIGVITGAICWHTGKELRRK